MELLPIHCFGWMLRQFAGVVARAYSTQTAVKMFLFQLGFSSIRGKIINI